MITKIHNIRGVGRFKDFECKQGIDFAELTLIYSENGQGKSTLADIFRALSEGDETRLQGRMSVGASRQFVKIMTDDGVRCLDQGSWNQAYADILVFDEIFINDNVYEGLHVRPDHRENLHGIIVGDAQVRGVQREEELVTERTELQAAKGKVEGRIKSQIADLVHNPEYRLKVEDFVALEKVDDIDTRIKDQEGIVAQLNDSRRIKSESKFETIDELVLPIDKLKNLLSKRLSGLAEDAKDALQAHVKNFSDDEMKSWLRRGTQYTRDHDDICPFCGQELSGSHLIEHYQAIFEDTYDAFEKEVSTFSAKNLSFVRWLSNVRSRLEFNRANVTFWAEHIPDLESPPLDYDLVDDALLNVKATMERLLDEKESALFKSVPVNATLQEALRRWDVVWRSVVEYTDVIASINSSIDDLRVATRSENVGEAERELARLIQTRFRYCQEVENDCALFTSKSKQHRELEKLVQNQRKANEELIPTTFKEYGATLDTYLTALGAGFCIKDLVQTRVRGILRADFAIGISKGTIEIGRPGTDVSERSFRNVLSEGDKRTLALALFLSKLEQMSNLQDTIVVFDDPVTSLDENRRMSTSEIIADLCEPAGQVIVLSHRPDFMHSVWTDYMRIGQQAKSCHLLEIRYDVASPDASEICGDWDIHTAAKSYHAKNIDNVVKFVYGPVEHEADYIWKLLRPILETHFRACYPDIYRGEVSSLGKFLGCIATCKAGSPLSAIPEESVKELNKLNIKLTPSQHGGDPPPTTNRNQLIPYCKRVLTLVGRPHP